MASAERQVAENIKHLMAEEGESIHSLQEKTGIPYNTLKRKIKQEGRGIDLYEIEAIAKAFNKTPVYLLEERRSQKAAA